MRLGLFGGTFNPIHYGHLRAAEEAVEILQLQRLLFIPAARPPHKNTKTVTPFAIRLAMTRLAVAEIPHFDVSDIENQRPEKSYSIETLRLFRRQFGSEVEIFFIVGLDAMLEIDTWKDYQDLFTLSHFFVLDRPGYDPCDLEQILRRKVDPQGVYQADARVFQHSSGNCIYFRPTTHLDISSSRIRLLASRGQSLRFLLPEEVRRFILDNKVYG